MDVERDVREFHRKFGHPAPASPEPLRGEALGFRIERLHEEMDELDAALIQGDVAHAVRECVDLAYVAIGTAVSLGADFGKAWRAVHAANMKKIANPGGKPIKPPGWRAPEVL